MPEMFMAGNGSGPMPGQSHPINNKICADNFQVRAHDVHRSDGSDQELDWIWSNPIEPAPAPAPLIAADMESVIVYTSIHCFTKGLLLI